MIVDLNKKFVDCFGREINQEGIESIGHLIAMKLFYAQQFTPEEKYRAYVISMKIGMNPSEVELNAEDAVLIKRICQETLTAGAYGQIIDIIEGRK